MQGVTILHEYQSIVDYLWEWRWYGIMFFCIAALLFVFMIYFAKNYDSVRFGVCLWLCAIAISIGILVQDHAIPVYENRYKVLIDETCSITEFFDKYEVLDKQGEIYIVKENSTD